MKGTEIRATILDAGLKLWQVADKFGCSDGNFSRKLRKNFSESDTERILKIIDDLKGKN